MRLAAAGGAISLAFLACARAAATAPKPSLVSGGASLALSADGTGLVFARGEETLLTFGPGAFSAGTVPGLDPQYSFDPYWLLVENPEPVAPVTWETLAPGETLSAARVSPTEMVVTIPFAKGSATLDVRVEAPGSFSLIFTPGAQPRDVAYLRLSPDVDPSEGLYGLGEWGDGVNERGKLRPMQMEIDDLEMSNDENHVPVPLLVGSRGWGLFVESERPGLFDVTRDSDSRVDVIYGTGVASAAGLRFHLFSEPQPLDIYAHYWAVTGAPGLPAPWALGPLLWRDEIADEAQLRDDVQEIRSLHLATSGVWFDRPYATGVETFDFDPAKFPDVPGMLAALHDAGLRYGVWQAPYTAPANSPDPAPAELEWATEHGFFPPETGLFLNDWGKPIDFTNPAAYAWWQDNLKRYTDPPPAGYGVEGFKLDYGEDIVAGVYGQANPWRFADGSDALTMHYGYTLLYHQIHRDLLPASGGFLLVRTGRWGDQTKGAIVWPGDLDASFAHRGDRLPDGTLAVGGLPAALADGIGLSASGFPFSASDTGGYRHAPPDGEAWVRWIEASSVWPAMETGRMPWETSANGWSPASLLDYEKFASLHIRLFPYVWSQAVALTAGGRPLVRPLGLAYPTFGSSPDDEYLLGDDLLVAPVVTRGATSRDVLFPPGIWYGFWDAIARDGGETGGVIHEPADLDTLPLFVRQGGIVPMLRESVETLSPVCATSGVDSFSNDPGVLWIRIAPGPTATAFTLYDGARITQQQTGATLAVAFTPGAAPVFAKGALFQIAPAAPPVTVETSAGALPSLPTREALLAAGSGWYFDPAGTLWIEIPGAANVTVGLGAP